jgi:glutamate carboxypeptidase
LGAADEPVALVDITPMPETSEMLDDLRLLVEIESPSHDVDALTRSAEAVAAMLERRTGRSAELVDNGAGPHVRWCGGGNPRVLLLGHHDTVFPLGALAERPFTVTDGHATGPGIFDMKAGMVIAAHAVAALRDPGGVEMLFTSDEEVGAETSRRLLEERAQACGQVLVFEGAADGGALKTERKGVGTFTVTIGGRAAHAGLEPEKGANALIEAAHQVLAIAALADPAVGTTVTPTVARAGTVENVVPDRAVLTVGVRVAEPEEARRVEAAFGELTPQVTDCTIDVTGSVKRGPLPSSISAGLFAAAVDVAAANGLEAPEAASVGGGSDGNFTAMLGVPTLDGLGAVGGGAHAAHEWIDTDQLTPRRALVTALLEAITAP